MIKLGARSGHNISYTQVRAESEKIPHCLNKIERSRVLYQKNGKKYVYPVNTNIIKYYDKYKLSSINDTNNDAWCVCEEINQQDVMVDNFISPSDVIFNNMLSEGYAVDVYTKNDELISPNYYTFDYYSGILVLTPDVTAEQKKAWGNLKITAFRYVGKMVNDYFKDLSNTIEMTKNLLSDLINEAKSELSGLIEKANAEIETLAGNAIAIQPYLFSTNSDKMVAISDVMELDGYTKYADGTPVQIQEYCITIPNYCWEISVEPMEKPKVLDGYVFVENAEVIGTEINHIWDEDKQTWESEIRIQVPVAQIDNEYKPKLGWYQSLDNRYIRQFSPIFGPIKFIAQTFVHANHKAITQLAAKQL